MGRLGGDEFVMIGHAVPTTAEAAILADRVMRTIEQQAELCGRPLIPSVSIGVALSAPHDSPDSVLAAAEGPRPLHGEGGRPRPLAASPSPASRKSREHGTETGSSLPIRDLAVPPYRRGERNAAIGSGQAGGRSRPEEGRFS